MIFYCILYTSPHFTPQLSFTFSNISEISNWNHWSSKYYSNTNLLWYQWNEFQPYPVWINLELCTTVMVSNIYNYSNMPICQSFSIENFNSLAKIWHIWQICYLRYSPGRTLFPLLKNWKNLLSLACLFIYMVNIICINLSTSCSWHPLFEDELETFPSSSSHINDSSCLLLDIGWARRNQ